MTEPAPPSTTSSPGTFTAATRPRGKRGTAALTLAILASIVSVVAGLALYVWFGLLLGGRSSWRRDIDWPVLLLLELVVAVPSIVACVIGAALLSTLQKDDEGYRRGRVAVWGSLGVAILAPLLSICAIVLGHAIG